MAKKERQPGPPCREAGAYRIDESGNIIPDENDEAMAERHGLKKNSPFPKRERAKMKEKEEDNAKEQGSHTGKD